MVFAEEGIEEGDFAVGVEVAVGGMVVVPVGVVFMPGGIAAFVADDDGGGGVFSPSALDAFLEVA